MRLESTTLTTKVQVAIILFILSIFHVNCNVIKSFGVHISSEIGADGSGNEYSMRLYYNEFVYSCIFNPAELDTSYYCNVNNFKVDTRCTNDGLGDYVMEIENPYNADRVIKITKFFVDEYTFDYIDYEGNTNSDNDIHLGNNDIMFIALSPTDQTITSISTEDNAGLDIDSFDIKLGIPKSRSSSMATMLSEVHMDDYVYKCKYNILPKMSLEYYSCLMQDWIRYKCIDGEADKTIILSNGNTYGIEIGSIYIGDRTIQDFCIPTEYSSVIPTDGTGLADDNQCECSGNLGNRESKFIELDLNNNVPVVSISFANGNHCNSESLITNAFSYYTLSITACDDLPANNNRVINVIARGTNGNTFMHHFGKNPDLLPHNGKTKEFNIGSKDIGSFVSANFELAYQETTDGDPFCISKIKWKNNINGETEQIYGAQYFGDGIYLAGQSAEDSFDFKLSPDDSVYLPMKQDQFQMSILHKKTNIRLLIHVCYEAYDNDGDFGGFASNLFVSVLGKTPEGKFVSSQPFSLSSADDDSFVDNSFRKYSFMVNHEFVEISFITIINPTTDMICIDEIEINDREAFLSNYFIGQGNCEGHGQTCSQQLYAVLAWPICSAEVIGIRTSNTVQSKTDSVISAAECSNQNRLFDVDCAISQTFEKTDETILETQSGKVTTEDFSYEGGFSYGYSIEVEFETGLFGVIGSKTTLGGSFETSHYFTVSDGTEIHAFNTTTTATSATSGETCEGSVSVPPLNSLLYTVSVEQITIESTTLTDIKYTKCSAAFADDLDDEDHYIYVYDIPGSIKTIESRSCSVEFSESTYTAVSIPCNEAVKQRALEFGTYMPICNKVDPTQWEPCQCAYGDTLTAATCICVDKTSGAPTESSKAVVIEGYGHWSEWCEIQCANSYYPPPISAAKSINKNIIDKDCTDGQCIDNNNNYNQLADLMYTLIFATLVMVIMIVISLLIFVVKEVYKFCRFKESKTFDYGQLDIVDSTTEIV